jgi:hypothetical protein
LRSPGVWIADYDPLLSVSVAVAVMLAFAVLVAVTVTVWSVMGAVAGALYSPLALMLPPPETDQFTELDMYQPTG